MLNVRHDNDRFHRLRCRCVARRFAYDVSTLPFGSLVLLQRADPVRAARFLDQSREVRTGDLVFVFVVPIDEHRLVIHAVTVLRTGIHVHSCSPKQREFNLPP